MKLLPNEDGLLYRTTLRTSDTNPTRNFEWRHLCALQPGTRQWLEQELSLDRNIVDAMLASGTRPRILFRKEGVMINLRGINTSDPDQPEDMISLRIWIDDHNIVTCRRRDLCAVEEVMELFERGQGPNTPGQFITMITTRVYSRMESFVEELERCVELLEDAFAKDSDDEVTDDAVHIRRRGTIYRRHILPQKGIIEGLLSGKIAWLAQEDKDALVESHDQIIRYTELLKDLQERTQILNEEIRSKQADRLNSTAYLFSVAATIFLPLSFLTGVMGINTAGVPGADSPWGFVLFVTLCVCLGIAQIVYFRKKRWF